MRGIILLLSIGLIAALPSSLALAADAPEPKRFELTDGSSVVGSVLDELEAGYLVRTVDGRTMRIPFERVVAVTSAASVAAALSQNPGVGSGSGVFPAGADLGAGFQGFAWGESPLESKAGLSTGPAFVPSRLWEGFTFPSEVGVLVEPAPLARWSGQRALIFSHLGLVRQQFRFEDPGVLEPLRLWISASLGEPELLGDPEEISAPVKYQWLGERVFLLRQPTDEGSFVALNLRAPGDLRRPTEEQVIASGGERDRKPERKRHGPGMRDGGGAMILTGSVVQIVGIALAAAGLDQSRLELVASGTTLGLSGSIVLAIGIPVHAVGTMRYRKNS